MKSSLKRFRVRRLFTFSAIIFLLIVWLVRQNHEALQKREFESIAQKRDLQRKQDLGTIVKLLQSYSLDHDGHYPQSDGLITIENVQNNVVFAALVPAYRTSLPEDPKSSQSYRYQSSDFGTHFFVSVKLENDQDDECSIIDSRCVYRLNEKGEVITKRVE